jgi:alpha-L-rhamnosidase
MKNRLTAIKKTLSDFKNPSSEFRGAPFWAWNGKLDPDELKWQIDVMKQMGMGGFFMHSRAGLETNYLSPEWMDCVETCIKEAQKQGMKAWLYDEDTWPSGFAGGLITKEEKYRGRQILLEKIINIQDVDQNIKHIALYRAEINNNHISRLTQINKIPETLNSNETLLRFSIQLAPRMPRYNNGSYVDTLNPEAIKKFIEVTHEAYKDKFSEYFGNTIPGIFTDEPRYGRLFSSEKLDTLIFPWTDSLSAVFKKRYNYDILDYLPEIVYNINETSIKIRYDYIDCITYMFNEAFSKQIAQWCEQNDLLLTGHILGEDTLGSQTCNVGSCMRFYEHMQAPGMDVLTEHWRVYDAAKQVSSVAHQFKRKWRLTETYGCTGWDFSFAGHKALGDWQLALGINFRCQHLAWYTMQGEAKRDYPASIFYQSAWWKQYSAIEEYFARNNLVMSQGEEIRDLLFIHPVESAWTVFSENYESSESLNNLNKSFVELRNLLLQEHIDFDYCDEDIMARHGRILTENDTPVLQIANAKYKAVIIPPLLTIRSSTIILLENFVKAGGLVVFASEPPQLVDAVKNDKAIIFSHSCKCSVNQSNSVINSLEPLCRRVSICDPDTNLEIGEILYLLREDKNTAYLFVCNTGCKDLEPQAVNNPKYAECSTVFDNVYIKLKTDIKGQVVEFYPENGSMKKINTVYKNKIYYIKTSLAALGSRIFSIIPEELTCKLPEAAILSTETVIRLQSENIPVKLNDYNVLPLDRASYRISEEPWQKTDYILFIDDKIRADLNLPGRSAGACQPWAKCPGPVFKEALVELQYDFEIIHLPGENIFLGIENPNCYDKILINGNELDIESQCGWWCDHSLRLLAIDQNFVIPGKNTITLLCNYNDSFAGLEGIFILGNFGVKINELNLSLTEPVSMLQLEDWTSQGLPFYSGSVSYYLQYKLLRENKKIITLRLNSFKGICATIKVNGKEAGIISYPPWTIDIQDCMATGDHLIEIEIFTSRRNSHGPLYMKNAWPDWTGPEQFHEFTGKYSLVPCGLMKEAELIFKTDMCV